MPMATERTSFTKDVQGRYLGACTGACDRDRAAADRHRGGQHRRGRRLRVVGRQRDRAVGADLGMRDVGLDLGGAQAPAAVQPMKFSAFATPTAMAPATAPTPSAPERTPTLASISDVSVADSSNLPPLAITLLSM